MDPAIQSDEQQDIIGESGTAPDVLPPPTTAAVTPAAAYMPIASDEAEISSEVPVVLPAPAPPLPPSPPQRVRTEPAPVPSTRALRMLLSVLKHNPTEVVQEVGVLLMLHASSIEVAKAAPTAGYTSSNEGGGGDGKIGRRSTPRIKEREELAKLKRRTQEAEDLLSIAFLASEEKGRRDAWENTAPDSELTTSVLTTAGAVKAVNNKICRKTRFYHQLREPARVEDRLRAWAATRGREVAALRELLGLSEAGKGKGSTAVVRPSPANAQLVLDRLALICAEKVEKVRTPVVMLFRMQYAAEKEMLCMYSPVNFFFRMMFWFVGVFSKKK